MPNIGYRLAILPVFLASLGGCASTASVEALKTDLAETKKTVEEALETAQQAKRDANTAISLSQQAQRDADGANEMARKAMADAAGAKAAAETAGLKAERMFKTTMMK